MAQQIKQKQLLYFQNSTGGDVFSCDTTLQEITWIFSDVKLQGIIVWNREAMAFYGSASE